MPTDGPANPARVYDYWLGGKDHYAVDRRVGAAVAAAAPWVIKGVRANRGFLERALTYLVKKGVDQVVDIGSGLPTARNVHQVTQELAPGARTLYVDHDPVVVAHAQALLATDEGTAAVKGDARDPEALFADPRVTTHINWSRPVAVLMVAILHFLEDADDPATVIAAFRQRMAPGSYLVISHVTPGRGPQRQSMREAVDLYEESTAVFTPRDRAAIESLFAGTELVEPGLVTVDWWQPDPRPSGDVLPVLAGVGKIIARDAINLTEA